MEMDGQSRTLAGFGGGGDGERLGQRGEVHPRGGRRRQAGGGEEKHRQHRQGLDALVPSHRYVGAPAADPLL